MKTRGPPRAGGSGRGRGRASGRGIGRGRGRGTGTVNFTRLLTLDDFAVFESRSGDEGDEMGGESMSSVGDQSEFFVDDSLGPDSSDTGIDEQDRAITDRAPRGPRMRRPTESKRRQVYPRGNTGFEGAQGGVDALMAMLGNKYAEEKSERVAERAGRDAKREARGTWGPAHLGGDVSDRLAANEAKINSLQHDINRKAMRNQEGFRGLQSMILHLMSAPALGAASFPALGAASDDETSPCED